jgi:hypothetical protein
MPDFRFQTARPFAPDNPTAVSGQAAHASLNYRCKISERFTRSLLGDFQMPDIAAVDAFVSGQSGAGARLGDSKAFGFAIQFSQPLLPPPCLSAIIRGAKGPGVFPA